MNKAQWDDLKSRVNMQFSNVILLCDGYLVIPRLERSKMKLYVAVYVNGAIRGKDTWHGKESEVEQMGDIARKFHSRKTIRMPAKEVKQWEAAFGKRECKKRGIYDGRVYTVPYFASTGGFIAHIRKQCQSIEEINHDDYQRRLAELEVADAT